MIEASEAVPYLCFVLKLEIPVVRELLSREEIQAPEASSDSPAMATGETTAELLDACCRLIDLLNSPQDIPFLSALIQREIIYRPPWACGITELYQTKPTSTLRAG